MLSIFQVGNIETHRVEIEQPFTASKVTVKVDDKVIVAYKARPFQFAHTIPFIVGAEETHAVELRINHLMSKYEAYVDGRLFIANMFPQALGYSAYFLALLAFIVSACSCMAIFSILFALR
jgi:hypothetical protein